MNDPQEGGRSADTRLVLFVHGSRDPRWREPFLRLAAGLGNDLGADRVRLVFMEFVGPTLEEVAAEAVRDGVRRLRLLPLFMAGGAHIDKDLPEQVATVRARHPDLAVDVLPPVGDDPRFVALLLRLAREAAGDPGA